MKLTPPTKLRTTTGDENPPLYLNPPPYTKGKHNFNTLHNRTMRTKAGTYKVMVTRSNAYCIAPIVCCLTVTETFRGLLGTGDGDWGQGTYT